MDLVLQALVIGIVQGLTEFLPISSSGHLILVPVAARLDGSVHQLARVRRDAPHGHARSRCSSTSGATGLRLVPAGLAAIRDRSFGGDPDRRLAWLLVATIPPAIVLGVLLSDFFEEQVREPILVAVMLVRRRRDSLAGRSPGAGARDGIERLGFARRDRHRLCAGARPRSRHQPVRHQHLAPGSSLGLTREAAARFSFLMATPVIAGAGLFEARKLVAGEVDERREHHGHPRRLRCGRRLGPRRHPRAARIPAEPARCASSSRTGSRSRRSSCDRRARA